MDNGILKKKLSTYADSKGRIRNVPDDLLLEVLCGWETWTGSKKDFYRAIGVSYEGMGAMLGKAKRLRREGRVPLTEFKEITDVVLNGGSVSAGSCQGIELSWEPGKVIRFQQVEQLIEFLKKSA